MPMPRRVPKRGFKNPNRIEAFPINVGMLEELFDAGATVDLETLRGKGVLPKLADHIKILGEGELTKQLAIRAHGVSATAREKVEKAGGSIEIVPSRRTAATVSVG
jgi:large subunit ribosomal protein L15